MCCTTMQTQRSDTPGCWIWPDIWSSRSANEHSKGPFKGTDKIHHNSIKSLKLLYTVSQARNKNLAISLKKPPSELKKRVFSSLIISAIFCFAFLAWSISTKSSILAANLSLGALLALLGAAIAFGVHFNHRHMGYMHVITRYSFLMQLRRSSTIRKGSIRYSILVIMGLMVGLGILFLGVAFIVSALVFNHYMLGDS